VRFALLNVQGLISKRVNKLKSVEIIEIFNKNDIICFTDGEVLPLYGFMGGEDNLD
jgi:hypothetical protein